MWWLQYGPIHEIRIRFDQKVRLGHILGMESARDEDNGPEQERAGLFDCLHGYCGVDNWHVGVEGCVEAVCISTIYRTRQHDALQLEQVAYLLSAKAAITKLGFDQCWRRGILIG